MPKANRIPLPADVPDWGAFKVAMFADASYQRVSSVADNQLAVTRLETFFAIQGGELSLVAQLWQMMIESCPASMQPASTEATVWSEIATDNDMPISFDSSGLLVINPVTDGN